MFWVDSELVCLLVSSLYDHMEVSLQTSIPLRRDFLSQSRVKLFIALFWQEYIKRFVHVVNAEITSWF